MWSPLGKNAVIIEQVARAMRKENGVSAKHLPSLRDEQEISTFLALILVFWLALFSPLGSVVDTWS